MHNAYFCISVFAFQLTNSDVRPVDFPNIPIF